MQIEVNKEKNKVTIGIFTMDVMDYSEYPPGTHVKFLETVQAQAEMGNDMVIVCARGLVCFTSMQAVGNMTNIDQRNLRHAVGEAYGRKMISGDFGELVLEGVAFQVHYDLPYSGRLSLKHIVPERHRMYYPGPTVILVGPGRQDDLIDRNKENITRFVNETLFERTGF